MDVNVQAATSAWLGTQPAQAELNLLKAQFAGVNLNNTIKALDVKHQQALEGLMQKRLQGMQQQSKNDPNAATPVESIMQGEIDDMMKAGMPVEAMDLATKFAGIQAKGAYVARTQAAKQQAELTTAINASRFQYEVAAPAAATAQSWEDFKLQTQMSGQPIPPGLAQMFKAPWTPNLQQQIQQRAMTTYQAALTADRDVRTKAYVATQAEQRRKSKLETNLDYTAKKAQAQQEGKDKGKLSSGQAVVKMTDANTLAKALNDEYDVPEATALVMSMGILEEVSSRMKANPGLGREQAMKDALDKRVKSQQLGGDSVNAKGATPEKAIKVDGNTEYEFNKWYNVEGKNYFYDQTTGALQPEENIMGASGEREDQDEGAASSVEPPPED